jgi:hypothetical protein
MVLHLTIMLFLFFKIWVMYIYGSLKKPVNYKLRHRKGSKDNRKESICRRLTIVDSCYVGPLIRYT